jgi:hypothetical protein
MQINTDLTGLFGITLAMLALLLRAPRVQALPLRQKAGVLLGVVVAISIPLWGLSLSGFVRGITGDLSITTLVLLALALMRTLSGKVLLDEADRHKTLQAFAIATILFYPFALGFTMLDPYRLGYGNLWFMAALLALAIWSSLRYSTFFAVCIALGVAAWSADWYESTNLWDYLLDPWLAIYVWAVQVKYWLARLRERMHA